MKLEIYLKKFAQLRCTENLLHCTGIIVYMYQYGYCALVELHGEAEPVSGSDLQRLLQHYSCLLPVSVRAQGADADLFIQVDLVPKRNSG